MLCLRADGCKANRLDFDIRFRSSLTDRARQNQDPKIQFWEHCQIWRTLGLRANMLHVSLPRNQNNIKTHPAILESIAWRNFINFRFELAESHTTMKRKIMIEVPCRTDSTHCLVCRVLASNVQSDVSWYMVVGIA